MTAAVPLVERLAEVLTDHAIVRDDFSRLCACGLFRDKRDHDGAGHRAHVVRALLPVVEQAVAEARGERADRHPEDYCHRCGGPNISWFTPGGVWDPVMRPVPGEPWKWEEIICPLCFVELAGGGSWTLIPVKQDRQSWTSADEREQIIQRAKTEALREAADQLASHACDGSAGSCGDDPCPFDESAQIVRNRADAIATTEAAPPKAAECCASGRCEVCTPGYVWGNS